jgi:carbamoyl-phosphate synthase large subunit
MELSHPLKSLKIDMWFLKQYEELYTLEKKFHYKVDTLPKALLEAKQKVLPTDKLHMMGCLESAITY